MCWHPVKKSVFTKRKCLQPLQTVREQLLIW
jgi:hypothetical protein